MDSTILSATVKQEVKHEEHVRSRAGSESEDEAEVEQQTRQEIPKSEYVDVPPTTDNRTKEPKEDEPGDPEAPAQSPRKPKPKGGGHCHGSSDVDTRSEPVLGADMLNLFNDEADADDEVKEKDHRSEIPARKSEAKSVESKYSNLYKFS